MVGCQPRLVAGEEGELLDFEVALGGGTLALEARLVCESSPAGPGGALVVAGHGTVPAHRDGAGGAGEGSILATLGM